MHLKWVLLLLIPLYRNRLLTGTYALFETLMNPSQCNLQIHLPEKVRRVSIFLTRVCLMLSPIYLEQQQWHQTIECFGFMSVLSICVESDFKYKTEVFTISSLLQVLNEMIPACMAATKHSHQTWKMHKILVCYWLICGISWTA